MDCKIILIYAAQDYGRRFHINMEGGGNSYAGNHFVRLFLWRRIRRIYLLQNSPPADHGSEVQARFHDSVILEGCYHLAVAAETEAVVTGGVGSSGCR